MNEISIFKNSLNNSIKNISSWNTESEYQQKKINFLLNDIQKFLKFIEKEFNFKIDYPFNEIYLWVEQNTCDECIEYIVSMMMEPFDNIIKPLTSQMSSEEDQYFTIPTNFFN